MVEEWKKENWNIGILEYWNVGMLFVIF